MRLARLAALAALAWALLAAPLAVEAQQATKIARIRYLALNLTARPTSTPLEAFRQGLRELGYVEGRNVVIEHRDAEGKLQRFPALTAELLALNVDVIVAPPPPAALADKHATKALPIVFMGSGDPVTDGLVTSLARPGGNITGLSNQIEERTGKRIQTLTRNPPGRVPACAFRSSRSRER